MQDWWLWLFRPWTQVCPEKCWSSCWAVSWSQKKSQVSSWKLFFKTMIYWTPNKWMTDGHLGKSLISANQTSSHWGDNRVLEILLALSFKRNEGMHKTSRLPVESPLSEKRFVKVWHLPQSMGWKNKTHSKPRPSFTMLHIYLRIPYDVTKKS